VADLRLGVKIGVQGGAQSAKEIKNLDDQVKRLQDQNAKAASTAKALGAAYNLSGAEVDQLINELRQLEGQTQSTAGEARKLDAVFQGLLQGFGQQLTQIGFEAFNQGIRAVESTIRGAVDAVSEFEAARAAAATLTNDVDGLVSALEGAQGRLNNQVTTNELLASSYDILSAGFTDAADAAVIAEQAAKGAVAGFSDAGTVADALTTILNAYGKSSADAAQVVDQLVKTQDLGKITIDQYAQTVGRAASIAATAGVSFEEFSASVAAATAKGVPAESAVSGTRQAIVNLLKPTADAEKILAKFGISNAQATLKSEGLVGVLRRLAEQDPTSEQLSKIFTDVDALAAISPVAGQNVGKLESALEEIGSASGAADRAIAQITNTLPNLAKQLRVAFLENLRLVGQSFEPTITAVLEFTQQVFTAASEGGAGLNLIAEAGQRLKEALEGNPEIAQALGEALADLANVSVEQFASIIDALADFVSQEGNIEQIAGQLSTVVDAIAALGQVSVFIVNAASAIGQFVTAAERLPVVGDNIDRLLKFPTPLNLLTEIFIGLGEVFSVLGDRVVEAVDGSLDRINQILPVIRPVVDAVQKALGLLQSDPQESQTAFDGVSKNLQSAFDSVAKADGALTQASSGLGDKAGKAFSEGVKEGVGDGPQEAVKSALDGIKDEVDASLSDLELAAANTRATILEAGGDPAKLAQAEQQALKDRIDANKDFLAQLKELAPAEGEDAQKTADQIRQVELTLANDRVALAQQVLEAKVKAAEEVAKAEVDRLKEARDTERESAQTEFDTQQEQARKRFGDEDRARQEAFDETQQNSREAFNESQRDADEAFQLRQQNAQKAFQKAQQAEAKRFQDQLNAERDRGNREFDALQKEVDRRAQLAEATGAERADLQRQFDEEDRRAKERRKIEQQVLNQRGSVLADQGDLLNLSPLEQARAAFEQSLQEKQVAFDEQQQIAQEAFEVRQRADQKIFEDQQKEDQRLFDKVQREDQKLFETSQQVLQEQFQSRQQAAEAAFNAQQRQLDEQSAQRQAAILESASRGIAPQVQARRDGGPVAAGQPYLVGEEGPELITPTRRGWVHTAGETAAIMARQPVMAIKPQAMAGVEAKLSELLQEVRQGRRVVAPTSFTLNTQNPLSDAVELQIKQVRALARGRVL
jgi:TP901 family phage tail tape measure protein